MGFAAGLEATLTMLQEIVLTWETKPAQTCEVSGRTCTSGEASALQGRRLQSKCPAWQVHMRGVAGNQRRASLRPKARVSLCTCAKPSHAVFVTTSPTTVQDCRCCDKLQLVKLKGCRCFDNLPTGQT